MKSDSRVNDVFDDEQVAILEFLVADVSEELDLVTADKAAVIGGEADEVLLDTKLEVSDEIGEEHERAF